MDKVKFNPFSEILDKDFNQQAEYVGDAVSMFIKDFLTADKAVVLGLDVKAQAVADMTVYVAPGRLYQVGKQGQLTVNSNPPLVITTAHPDYDRIDRICARYAEIDDEPETRNIMIDTVSRQVVQKTVMTRTTGAIEFIVVNGTAAPVPAAPTVPEGWVSLAKVTVKQNATSIAQADITDERPTISAYLAHKHTGGGDGARIDYKSISGAPDLDAHNADTTAHANGIAGNAATATRLKAALSGSRNQCWLLCKLPKNSYALVHYKILGAQYYDQYSVLEVAIKNGAGWCKYTGFSANYQVSVKAYETDNSIDVYLFAQNFDDIWEVLLKKNNAVMEFAYKKMGNATYTPSGTLVCDTTTGKGMDGVELFNGKEKASGMPLGSIMPFLSKTPPPGWLACDTGAIVSRATYADLWVWVQANAPLVSEAEWQAQAAEQSSVGAYSTGDGSTTFRLPRIVDYVRGGLQSEVGVWQGDAIRNITGTLFARGIESVTTSGALKFSGTNWSGWGHYNTGVAGTTSGTATIDASNVVPTANENRPKTVKMMYCVKAFNAETNPGLIDITALANEMTSKVNVTDYIADFAHNHSANGYQKLPGGLILQWGRLTNVTMSTTVNTVTFPIAFPSACLNAQATICRANAINYADSTYVHNLSKTSMSIICDAGYDVSIADIYYFVIGR